MEKKISKVAIERIYKINCKIETLKQKRDQIIVKEVERVGILYIQFDREYGKATAGR